MARVPTKRSLAALYNIFTNNITGKTTNEDIRDLAYSCYTNHAIVEHTGNGNTDIELGENVSHKLSLTANTVLSFSEPVAGRVYTIVINAVTYALKFPAMLWIDGIKGTVTANGTDILQVYYDGTYYYAYMFNDYQAPPPDSVSLTYPNGGEVLYIYDTCTIRWSAVGLTFVKISYSIDNGANYTTIVSSYSASAGSYDWLIPVSAISTNCLIKIESASDSSVYDVSGNVFSIGYDPTKGYWEEVADTLGDETKILALFVYDSKLYGGTYPNGKLYRHNVDEWKLYIDTFKSQNSIYSLVEYGGRLFAGTGSNGKLFRLVI